MVKNQANFENFKQTTIETLLDIWRLILLNNGTMIKVSETKCFRRAITIFSVSTWFGILFHYDIFTSAVMTMLILLMLYLISGIFFLVALTARIKTSFVQISNILCYLSVLNIPMFLFSGSFFLIIPFWSLVVLIFAFRLDQNNRKHGLFFFTAIAILFFLFYSYFARALAFTDQSGGKKSKKIEQVAKDTLFYPGAKLISQHQKTGLNITVEMKTGDTREVVYNYYIELFKLSGFAIKEKTNSPYGNNATIKAFRVKTHFDIEITANYDKTTDIKIEQYEK